MITLKESMAKMIIVKGEIAVVDLTDDVALGKEAIAFGAFSDVWQGEWWDRVEMRQRTVRDFRVWVIQTFGLLSHCEPAQHQHLACRSPSSFCVR